MKTYRFAVLAGCFTCMSPLHAQDWPVEVSLGVRAWYAQWTTFSYIGNPAFALSQVSADNKLVLVPAISARYGNFSATLSALPATRFTFADGGSGTRKEIDANLGYAVVPGLTLTAGFKEVSQRDGEHRYEPKGWVLGLNGNAPLSDGLSLYGNLGVGRLKTPTSGGDEIVKFKADYRLTEIGLAYALNTERIPRRWTFTAGYRIQVMSSKQAIQSQDGRDTTQGVTAGAIVTF